VAVRTKNELIRNTMSEGNAPLSIIDDDYILFEAQHPLGDYEGSAVYHVAGLNKDELHEYWGHKYLPERPWLVFASTTNFLELMDYVEVNPYGGYFKVTVPVDAKVYRCDTEAEIYCADMLDLSDYQYIRDFPLFQDSDFIQKHPKYFPYSRVTTETTRLKALDYNPEYIAYMENRSEACMLKAVKADGMLLKHFRNAGDTVVMAAIENNIAAITLAAKPTLEMWRYVLGKNIKYICKVPSDLLPSLITVKPN
jgi:hypothetical protein